MKLRIKLILLSIISVGILSAQTYRLELGSVNPKQSGSQLSTNYFNGVRLGGTVEFDLKNNFSLLSGVLYSLVYSNKVQYYSSSDSVNYKTFGHSVDIPLRLTYTLPLFKNVKVFGFVGPNLNIGLAQPRKTTAVLSSSIISVINEFTGNVPVTGTEDMYKAAMISRINFQMGAGGGVQWKNYQLKGGYDFGINSINKIDSSRFTQSGWYVSLVYQF